MRRFLYYFPGVPGMNARMLADRGALDRFTGHGGRMIEHGVTTAANGPDGGGGCIVAAGATPPETGRVRHWHQGEKFWVGMETLPPEPADLVRDIVLAGYKIGLSDGNAWQVPCLRQWDTEKMCHVSALPKSVRNVVAADGSNIGAMGINPRYAPMDKLAERVWLNFIDNRTVPMAQALADAGELLAINYRMGVEEIGLLGLMDDVLLVKVLGLCVDSPTLEKQAAERSYSGLHASDPEIEEEEA